MGVADLIVQPVATLVTDLVDRLFPDKDKQAAERAEILEKAQALDNQLAQGQMAIDAEEAKSSSLFVAGARPAFLWVCAAAFAYKYLIQPFAIFALIATGSKFDYHQLPIVDWTDMMALALPLLGVSGMRSYEKIQGLTK